ncbi:MAG: thioredoxin family protein [Phycisphaerae bacterium]
MRPSRHAVAFAMLLVALAPAFCPADAVAASRAAEEAAAAAAGRTAPDAPSTAPQGPGGAPPQPKAAKKPLIPIAWRTHLDAACNEAAKRGICTLIYFRADWCSPCRLMGKGTFTLPAVAQYINRHFVPVKVDDSEGRSEATKRYEIRVYPSVLFLDPGGKPLHLVLGPREAEPFYRILEQVKDLPRLMDRQHAHPESLEANFELGNALAKLNHLRRAAPYLKKAADLDPENEAGRRSQARLILAVVPLEEGDSQKALANLEAWLEAFPDAPEVPVAIWYQGTILYQDGKLAEAKGYFEEIIRRFPKHAKAYEADKAIGFIERRMRAERLEKAGTDADNQDSQPKPKG